MHGEKWIVIAFWSGGDCEVKRFGDQRGRGAFCSIFIVVLNFWLLRIRRDSRLVMNSDVSRAARQSCSKSEDGPDSQQATPAQHPLLRRSDFGRHRSHRCFSWVTQREVFAAIHAILTQLLHICNRAPLASVFPEPRSLSVTTSRVVSDAFALSNYLSRMTV